MEFLLSGILAITWQQVIMYCIGGLLIYLAIGKGFEPALLMPMGFGAILVNLPLSGVLDQILEGGIESHVSFSGCLKPRLNHRKRCQSCCLSELER